MPGRVPESPEVRAQDIAATKAAMAEALRLGALAAAGDGRRQEHMDALALHLQQLDHHRLVMLAGFLVGLVVVQ